MTSLALYLIALYVLLGALFALLLVALFKPVNWYRGFYRTWALISLIWLVVGTSYVGYGTWKQWWFTRNLAETRASAAALTAKGDLPSGFVPDALLIDKQTGKDCTESNRWAIDFRCSTAPEGPWPGNELVVAWAWVFGPVLAFYVLLRGTAWILRGFRREA